MAEYIGRYSNTLDAKGRVNMPAKFRDSTERDKNGDHVFVLTKGTERYIAMFPIDEWRKKINDVEAKVEDGEKRRILNRRMNFSASPQKVDKQGRINIPAELIEYAGLNKDLVVMGSGKKIEIWNPQALEKHIEKSESFYQEFSNLLDF